MSVLMNVLMCKRYSIKKIVAFIAFLIAFFVIYEYSFYRERILYNKINSNELLKLKITHFEEGKLNGEIIDSFYNKRRDWNTSNLGSVLFKNINSDVFRENSRHHKTFTVLIWRYWDWLQNRHLYNFGSSRKDVSLDGCSTKNCVFTKNEQYLETADAVVIHLQHGEFPNTSNRNPRQRWIFLSDESPKNAFSLSKKKIKLQELANVFNWSMSYRSESDVPVPYGRTLPLANPFSEPTSGPIADLVPHWNKKRSDVLMAVLMSNCAVSRRMDFLNELKKHINVDVHGRCSENFKDSCPGHFRSDCPVVSEYLFYLVLENSMCEEYLTEKVFYHAYYKGAIPIIMGPKQEDCEKILPPNSFLHVDNYPTIEELAIAITNLSKDIPTLLKFHEWRRHFQVVNEHGYFGSQSRHYCRICEALNYNDNQFKTYDEIALKNFLDPSLTCR